MKVLKIHASRQHEYTTRNSAGDIVTVRRSEDKSQEIGGSIGFGVLHSQQAFEDQSYRNNRDSIVHAEYYSELLELGEVIVEIGNQKMPMKLVGEMNIKSFRMPYNNSPGYTEELTHPYVCGYHIPTDENDEISTKHEDQRFVTQPVYAKRSAQLLNRLGLSSRIEDMAGMLDPTTGKPSLTTREYIDKTYVISGDAKSYPRHVACSSVVDFRVYASQGNDHHASCGLVTHIFTALNTDTCEQVYEAIIEKVRTEQTDQYNDFLELVREGYPSLNGAWPEWDDNIGTARTKLEAHIVNDMDESTNKFEKMSLGSTQGNIKFKVTETTDTGKRKRWLVPEEYAQLKSVGGFTVLHDSGDDRVTLKASPLYIKEDGKDEPRYCRTYEDIEDWKARDIRNATYGPTPYVQVMFGKKKYNTNIKVQGFPETRNVMHFFKNVDGVETQVRAIKLGENISGLTAKILDLESNTYQDVTASQSSLLEGFKGNEIIFDVQNSELTITCDGLYYIKKSDSNKVPIKCDEEEWKHLREHDKGIICGPIKALKVKHDGVIYDTGILISDYPVIQRVTSDDTNSEDVKRVPLNEIYQELEGTKISVGYNPTTGRPVLCTKKLMPKIWIVNDSSFEHSYKGNFDTFRHDLITFLMDVYDEYISMSNSPSGMLIPACEELSMRDMWGGDRFSAFVSVAFTHWFRNNRSATILRNAVKNHTPDEGSSEEARVEDNISNEEVKSLTINS